MFLLCLFLLVGTSISCYGTPPENGCDKNQNNCEQNRRDQNCMWRTIESAQPFSYRAASQRAERWQTNQRYGIVTHHAAAHFVWNHDINKCRNNGGEDRGCDSHNKRSE